MKRQGFTLIELLVVIAIIAVLAAILFPVFTQAKRSAQESQCISNMKQIMSGTLLYTNDWDGHTVITSGTYQGAQAMSAVAPYTYKGAPFTVSTVGGETIYALRNVWVCPNGIRIFTLKNHEDKSAGNGYGWNGCVSCAPYNASGCPQWLHLLGGEVSGIKLTSRTAMWGEVIYSLIGWGPYTANQYHSRHGGNTAFSFTSIQGTPGSPCNLSIVCNQQDPSPACGFNVAYWDGHVKYIREVPYSDYSGGIQDRTWGMFFGYLMTWWSS